MKVDYGNFAAFLSFETQSGVRFEGSKSSQEISSALISHYPLPHSYEWEPFTLKRKNYGNTEIKNPALITLVPSLKMRGNFGYLVTDIETKHFLRGKSLAPLHDLSGYLKSIMMDILCSQEIY